MLSWILQQASSMEGRMEGRSDRERDDVISPEQQIANVRASLERARGSRPYAGRAWHIRSAEQQLAELEAQHAAGTLGPIGDDGSPF